MDLVSPLPARTHGGNMGAIGAQVCGLIGSIDQGRLGKWRDLVGVNNCFPACAAMIATGCVAVDTLCPVPQFLARMLTGWRGIVLFFPLRLKLTRLSLRHLRFKPPSVSQSEACWRGRRQGWIVRGVGWSEFLVQRSDHVHDDLALILCQPLVSMRESNDGVAGLPKLLHAWWHIRFHGLMLSRTSRARD
jgi:hypothetical protein